MPKGFKNERLFRILRPEGTAVFQEQTVLENFLVNNKCPKSEVKEFARLFRTRLDSKWQTHQRKESRFIKKEAKWLGMTLVLPSAKKIKSGLRRGRPNKDFMALKSRARRTRIAKICSTATTEELACAAGRKLRSSGHGRVGKALTAIATKQENPSDIFPCPNKHAVPATPVEAASLVIACDLTKDQYGSLRRFCADHEAPLLPSYDEFRAEKELCYPDAASTTITGTCAYVSLQALLDKTTTRLMEMLGPVVSTLSHDSNILLDCKGGFDGSSMHKAFKQSGNSSLKAENTMVLTGVVPLRLTASNGHVLYQNDSANSSLACRPLRIEYAKESLEYVTGLFAQLQEQAEALVPTVHQVDNKTIAVSHRVSWSMFDGKIKAQLTGSSNQSCNVCGAKPCKLNAIPQNIQRNPLALQLGCSPLHCCLRFFDLIISLGERLGLPTRKWQTRGAANQKLKSDIKHEMQQKFRDQMGLLVDVPLSGGVGNTTDGNTARKAFEARGKRLR